MKKILALAAMAVIYVILFAGVPIGGFLLLFLAGIEISKNAYLALAIFVFAGAAFGFAALINKVKKVFTDKMEFLPLTYYITAFLPSLGISAVYFGLVIQKINSDYYSDSFGGDWDKIFDLTITAVYFFFTAATAIFTFVIYIYRKKKERLNQQVDEYIKEHKD